jgi:hypothetical protein
MWQTRRDLGTAMNVRSVLVSRGPEQWAWSSDRQYAYDEAQPVLVNELRRAELPVTKSSELGPWCPRFEIREAWGSCVCGDPSRGKAGPVPDTSRICWFGIPDREQTIQIGNKQLRCTPSVCPRFFLSART